MRIVGMGIKVRGMMKMAQQLIKHASKDSSSALWELADFLMVPFSVQITFNNFICSIQLQARDKIKVKGQHEIIKT